MMSMCYLTTEQVWRSALEVWYRVRFGFTGIGLEGAGSKL